MTHSHMFWRWTAAALLALMCVATGTPADAQRTYGRGGGFFDSLFGPRSGYWGPQQGPRQYNEPRVEVDSSRAPSPKKPDGIPTMSVMVLGDSMADWLGYGLEEAFADSPEIGVVRKPKAHSGLVRYESRSDLDWWHVARDLLSKDKVDFVVMMLGVDDRTNIRETQGDRPADKKKPAETPKDGKADQDGKPEAKADNKPDESEESSPLLAPEPKRGAGAGVVEFRTERWEQIYSKRIDETIAALKSKGVPVIWVGLPPIRGTRSTADAGYLNDLYRARAEHAGIVYVDVWDGFVDESGKFTYMGPDFEGQNRRLRSGDGVHFTKSGARKLAHYVERELRRFISNRSMPMAVPSGTPTTPEATGPAARPVAGPVMPLTAAATGNDELLGGGATRPAHSDPVATRVLVKGEPAAPAPGRADDFRWPRGSADASAAEPLSPTAAAARAEPATAPKTAAKPESKQAARDGGKDADKREKAVAPKPKSEKPVAREQTQGRPSAPVQPRPQQPQTQRQSGGLFGLFR